MYGGKLYQNWAGGNVMGGDVVVHARSLTRLKCAGIRDDVGLGVALTARCYNAAHVHYV